MRIPLSCTLTPEERPELEFLAHSSRSVPALTRRARIVLACAAEQDNQTVARRLRVTPATVVKWRTRFVRRLAGLYDEPRPGAPRSIDDDAIECVVVRTLESTPRGATHWSTRALAQGTGLSHMDINRIRRAFGLQPHPSQQDQSYTAEREGAAHEDEAKKHDLPLVRQGRA